MRHRVPGHFATKFINRVVASQLRRPLRLLLLCTVPLGGCLAAKFQGEFVSATAQPPQSSHPLIGAWEGSWQSQAEGDNHVARAVISMKSQGSYEVRLEMSDFEPQPGLSLFPFEKYWIALPDLSVTTTSGGAEQFQAKARLRLAYKTLRIADAMTLRGKIEGESLHIQFTTDDAVHEVDCGQIDLRRIVSQ
jgi:hypothetical protein